VRVEARPTPAGQPPEHLWLSLQDAPRAALPAPIKRLLESVV
jgi:hypothetical protein